MKPFTTILAIAIIFSTAAYAGSGNPSTVIFPRTFAPALKEKKDLFETNTAKICACQVLRVASNNENGILIAVFAQGTNNGDLSVSFAAAISVLEKEKKHLKDFFYTTIKTAENVSATTECSMLYKNLQVKYSNVKMYDVLDADALSDKKVANK